MSKCLQARDDDGLTTASSGATAKWFKWFLWSASGILALTGGAKILGAFGNALVLGVTDPIFGLPFRGLMLLTGAAELAIAFVCLFQRKSQVSAAWVAWLAAIFVSYRVGLHWVGWKKPCSCLGALTDALHIQPHTADSVATLLAGYLLVGSCALLWMHGLRRRF